MDCIFARKGKLNKIILTYSIVELVCCLDSELL